MTAFARLPDIANVVPRSAADDALFAELADVLERHGARDRFGIALLHSNFAIRDGEVLIEETDVANRIQTIAPASEPPAQAIETLWRLGEDRSAIVGCLCPTDDKGNHTGEHVYTKGR